MFLSTDDINWLSENYIESISDCIELLYEYEKKGALSKESLIEGCRQMRLFETSKGSMSTHLDLLYRLGVLGVSAKTAGIKIRGAIHDRFKMTGATYLAVCNRFNIRYKY